MQHLSLASGVEADLQNDLLSRIGLGLQGSDAREPSVEPSPKPSRSPKRSRT
jgi:hypothetical protein